MQPRIMSVRIITSHAATNRHVYKSLATNNMVPWCHDAMVRYHRKSGCYDGIARGHSHATVSDCDDAEMVACLDMVMVRHDGLGLGLGHVASQIDVVP